MRKAKTKNNKQEDLVYKVLKKIKNTGLIGKGILETTRAVEKRKAKLIIIAKNVIPKTLISHLPTLCRQKNIPYIWVKSKEKLGKVLGLEVNCTSCAIIEAEEELIKKLIKI